MSGDLWKAMRLECKRLFGFEPSHFQVRLWYFGQSTGQSEERKAHREKIEREVCTWDGVIKLAMLYTKHSIKVSGVRWEDKAICRFVYHLIWRKYELYEKQTVKGEKKDLPTWWVWALENRRAFKPIISKSGAKSMKYALRKVLEVLED